MKYLLFIIVAAAVILIACSQGDRDQDSTRALGNTSAPAEPKPNQPTPTPETVCDPGYVPGGRDLCCPADYPTLAWGDSCVGESQASWAIDSVTHWFFGLAGLAPTDVDLDANRDTCTANPHSTDRYWLLRCVDTGGEYLVHHDTGDVSPANDLAQEWVTYMTLVGLIRSQAATRSYEEWRLERDLYDLQSDISRLQGEIQRLESCLQFDIGCPP